MALHLDVSLPVIRARVERVKGVAQLRRLVQAVKTDDLLGGAAELAFRLFLALFPFFIFLTALAAFLAENFGVSDPSEEIINLLGDSLPPDTASVLRKQLDEVTQATHPELISIGFLGALVAASGGVATIVKVGNRVYSLKETRPFLLRYAMSLALTLFGGVCIVVAFLVMIGGRFYGGGLAADLGLDNASMLLLAISWLAGVVLAASSVCVLYSVCPNARLTLRSVAPGAVVFVAAGCC
jgi:membrane protein